MLAMLGDSVTTDHISPAGSIKKDWPAGRYLQEHGVEPRDFNSYGSRRGNHEVMMRGTFANIRLRNQLAPGTEGGVTRHLPERRGDVDLRRRRCATRARACRSSCSAARSTARAPRATGRRRARKLLGVRAVIAESFERIHRSNLVGMGVLPLQFAEGETAESLGLTGEEEFTITGSPSRSTPASCRARSRSRPATRSSQARVRIDTPKEADYFRHGGILPYVLRQLRAA